jgi:hypothetical protein
MRTKSVVLCCGAMLGLATAGIAMPATASARTVRTVPITGWVTTVDLKVPHTTGRRPPAILLSTTPSNLGCAVSRYTYHAVNRKAEFRMRLACRRLKRGARIRLVFRAPYERVFPIHDGTGTIRVRLDKPPGRALPLGQLTTRPRATHCTATPTGMHVGVHVFTASARVECHGLPPHAKGVLSVGGLLAPSDIAMSSASPATARASAVKPCSSARTLSALGHSISWIYCYTPSTTLGPWQSTFVGILPPNPPCSSPWRRVTALDSAGLRVILSNLYPPAVYVDPTSAWAWSDFLGLVTNWQFSGDITVQWQYNCYQVH